MNYVPQMTERLLTAQNLQEMSMKDCRDTQEVWFPTVDLL